MESSNSLSRVVLLVWFPFPIPFPFPSIHLLADAKLSIDIFQGCGQHVEGVRTAQSSTSHRCPYAFQRFRVDPVDGHSDVGSSVSRPTVSGCCHEGERTQGVPDVSFHYTNHLVKSPLHSRTTQHSTIWLQPNN